MVRPATRPRAPSWVRSRGSPYGEHRRTELRIFTIFTVPKPFLGHIGVIQDNALRSWVTLGAGHEVVLYGDEDGVSEAAAHHGVRHVAQLGRNELGTPLVSDVFARAQRDATHEWLCYANCDVIFTSDLPRAIERLRSISEPVLASGRRWRMDVIDPLAFAGPWEARWNAEVRERGTLDVVLCMDYFIFRRGLIPQLPPFALGRTRWDSYLPYRARELGAMFVDATDVVLAVHQDHAYASTQGKPGMRASPEAKRNRRLVEEREKCTLGDASHRLTDRGLHRAIDGVRLRYWLYLQHRRPVLGIPLRVFLRLGGRRAKTRLVG